MSFIRKIFIIVPSASMASPVKGAAALANAISCERSVCFVALKPGIDGFKLLDARVDRVSLSDAGSWPARLIALRRLLRDAGGKSSVAALSLCLSADIFNMYCRNFAVTCSSVRGNLPLVYSETYGLMGRWIAYCHLRMLKRLDCTVSMTEVMAEQVQKFIGGPSPVIGNFVDETLLARFRHSGPSGGPFRFVYTGSMIRGKQPQLLLKAIHVLQKRGIAVRLDAFGDGPLLESLRGQLNKLPQPHLVFFHGHVSDPYETVAKADALVLPSLTEGVSRSALEALFLGVPCVLRDVDGNRELVRTGLNGGLFQNEDKLADVMLQTAEWSRRENPNRECLTPPQFRQRNAVKKLLDLLDGGVLLSS